MCLAVYLCGCSPTSKIESSLNENKAMHSIPSAKEFSHEQEIAGEIHFKRSDLTSSVDGFSPMQSCLIDRDYMVVSVDVGNKGMESTVLRPRRPGESFIETCQREKDEKDVAIEHVPFRTASNVVLTHSAGGHAGGSSFHAFEPTSGHKIFESDYLYTELPKLSADGLSVDFFKPLNGECEAELSAKACWSFLLRQNEIPPSIHLALPKCELDASMYSEELGVLSSLKAPHEFNFFVKVRVRFGDEKMKQKEVLEDDAQCVFRN